MAESALARCVVLKFCKNQGTVKAIYAFASAKRWQKCIIANVVLIFKILKQRHQGNMCFRRVC